MQYQQEYTTVVRPGDNGNFMAHTPALSSTFSWAKTPDQARGELIYIFEMIQPEYEENERSQPEDVQLITEEEHHQIR